MRGRFGEARIFPLAQVTEAARPGFFRSWTKFNRLGRTQPDAVDKQAEQLTSVIKANQKIDKEKSSNTDKTTPLSAKLIDGVANTLAEQFDPQFGGFGYSVANPNQPKFPEPSNLIFLLDRMNRDSVAEAARNKASSMLVKTLDGMISGAMLDHLGGGFHRYSVDRSWQIPHFEKMLYDNGQLASVFAEAHRATERDEYRQVAEGICDFVIRELSALTKARSTVRSMRTARGRRVSSMCGRKRKSRASPTPSTVGLMA